MSWDAGWAADVSAHFEGSSIYWKPETHAHEVTWCHQGQVGKHGLGT
jgi:hypothetical protein